MFDRSNWVYLKQQQMIRRSIRNFFDSRGYLEVQTPVLVTTPGTEEHLEYFESAWVDHQGKGHPVWMRSSPELHMKQILPYAEQSIYQIAPSYRNGGELSAEHLPEFNMLEWYEMGSHLDDLIATTIGVLDAIYKDWCQNFTPPSWSFDPDSITTMTVVEAFKRFSGIELVDQDPELSVKARAAGVRSVAVEDDFETAFFKVLLEKVEPGLAQLACVVLKDYPASQAILSRVEGGVAKRFEIYISGVELCNGFYELLEESLNRERILAAQEFRQKEGKQVVGEDEDFYTALRQGIPECAGNALGVDRFHGLLAEKKLADCIPFARRIPFGKYLADYTDINEGLKP